MGKRSVKENKNIYQRCREACGLSREAASDLMMYISPERIERIESEKSRIHPDEVLMMEKGYKAPELSNYFCTHECPIGQKYVPEAHLGDFSQVTVGLIAAVNSISEEKDRLLSIAVDGRVNDFERKDFDEILRKLAVLETTIESMKIWIEHASGTGKLDEAR